MRLMPWMKLLCSMSGSPRDLDVGEAAQQLFEHHADLAAGEVGAEAEVRATGAEPEVLVRRAQNVEAEGVVERALVPVGRVVEHHDLLPSFTACPPTTTSRVAVRRKLMTGVAQRTISSTAVGDTASKSEVHTLRWSGYVVSARMP